MNSRQLPPPDGALTNALKELSKFHRRARVRHNHRQKKAERDGVYNVFDRSIEGYLLSLGEAITTVRKSVKRIPKLEEARKKEEMPKDKTEGRNRYSVAYGKE